MKSKILALSAVSIISVLASNHANATNIFDPSVSNSPILDSSSVRLDGTIHAFGPSANVWTIDAFAGANECVRFFVSTQFTDTKLVVVAPNGAIYRNNNGGGSLRPLVKIANSPNNGWYTVHLASASGAPVEGNFTLLYGRYTSGNVNCAAPTAPLSGGGASSSSAPELVEDQLDQGPVVAPDASAPGGGQ
ncbi:MAG: hypothetical protein WAV82_00070 [Methylobacter sp.]